MKLSYLGIPFKLVANILYFVCGMLYTIAETCETIASGPRIIPVPRAETKPPEHQPEDIDPKVAEFAKVFTDEPDLFREVVIEMAMIAGQKRHDAMAKRNSMGGEHIPTVPEVVGDKKQKEFPIPDFLKSSTMLNDVIQGQSKQGVQDAQLADPGGHSHPGKAD